MIKIFNTLTKKTEDFIPQNLDEVLMYTCGPTVYDFAHIGNMRYNIFVDILRRTLKHAKFTLRHVMNITDVEDKTIAGSQKMGNSLLEYTNYYSEAFFEDLKSLNLEEADNYPKATEYVPQMIELVSDLLEKGIAYNATDGIYFDIKRFPEYGRLSGQKLDGVKHGARVAADTYDKENAGDFVVWKFWQESDGEVFWEAPFGKGRPGWHIECSAMIKEFLGETIDIHAGGEDLIFPHHENEIAQSESVNGATLAKYWIHSRHLMVDGKKMSKSLNNFYTLRDLSEKGFDPLAFKLLVLQAHYRSPLNFTLKELEAAQTTLNSIKNLIWSLEKITKEGEGDIEIESKITKTTESFWSYIDDDMSTPQALAEVFGLINQINSRLENLTTTDVENILAAFDDYDQVLGLLRFETDVKVPEEVQVLVKDRDKAREEGNFDKADKIRDELKLLGWEVLDTQWGAKISRV